MDSYIIDALNEVLEWDLPDEVIGEAVLLAVEGDNSSAGYLGINLADLASMMLSLGCTDAINLDGGGSTSMVIGNRLTVRPGDNGVERPVASALLIKQR